ncbi:MAG: FmdB family zinc ribbon protein [Usitatibacter sp.]
MPIYEYRCSSCGFQKEFLQKVSAPLLTVCPECGKETFSKMLTAAGFQLKGSGWYVTDFRNKGASPSTGSATGPKAESGAESKGESKGEVKGESKSEAKGESKSEAKAESKSEAKAESKTESKPAGGSGSPT